MKRIIFILLTIVFVAVTPLSDTDDKIHADIISEIKTAVVTTSAQLISTEDLRKEIFYKGAGFFVQKDSRVYLITAKHILAGNQLLTIFIEQEPGQPELSKTIYTKEAYHCSFDFVIIRLDLPPDSVKTLKLADSDKVKIGDDVLTMGNPEASGKAGSKGKIFQIRKEKCEFVIDMVIYPGNSGGPLVNLNGEVIGIVYARWKQGCKAYAIVSNVLIKGLDEYIKALEKKK